MREYNDFDNATLIEWHDKNKKVKSREVIYKNGKLQSVKRWHENGQIEYSCPYDADTEHKKSRRHGFEREWHKNGKLSSSQRWVNSKKVGNYTTYYDNGQLESVMYERPSLKGLKENLEFHYHPDGSLKAKKLYHMRHWQEMYGMEEEFYPNGKPESVCMKPYGLQKMWYQNGNVKQEYFTNEHGHHGDEKEYHQDGTLSVLSHWDNGERVGKWETYDEKGELTEVSNYKNGRLDGEHFKIEKGITVERGKYENNQKVDVWVEDKGKVVYYISGVPVPKKLYDTPPEKLDVLKAVKEENSQLKAVLFRRIGYERIIKELGGKVINSEGDMELIDLDLDDDSHNQARFLKVKCPSTGTFYALRVPPDYTECEAARQWTLHNDDGRIKFLAEA